MKKKISLSVLVFILLYLIAIFLSLELDFRNWKLEGRIMLIWIWVIFSGAIAIMSIED
jgi:hypothetical protein